MIRIIVPYILGGLLGFGAAFLVEWLNWRPMIWFDYFGFTIIGMVIGALLAAFIESRRPIEYTDGLGPDLHDKDRQ